MSEQSLIDTAAAMVAGDKGLLAMDASNPTCNKRFAAQGIPQNEERRRAYREMIVTTPGLSDCISGAILYDETIQQQTTAGAPFVKHLTDVEHHSWHQSRRGYQGFGGPSWREDHRSAGRVG